MNMPTASIRKQNDGFTIVELAVIVPVLIIVIIILFQSLFYLVRSSGIDRETINTTYDVHNALGIIESDTLLTSTFLPTTDSSITDVYKPTTNSGQWSYLGDDLASDTRVLILRAFNTTTNPLSSSRQPSFLTTQGCDPSTIYSNEVLQYNIIYFVKDGNLYRRRALDTTKATCETPYQKQSCPSLESLGSSSRDTTCQADDELVARNVSSFLIQYYANSNSTVPIDAYTVLSDPESVTAAAAVEVTMTISRNAYGKNVSSTSSIRVAKVNAPRIEE